MKSLARLETAVRLSSIDGSHGPKGSDYIVAGPATGGPQACLIETHHPLRRGMPDIVDAFVILPAVFPPGVQFAEPAVTATLAIAAAEYKKDIAAAANDPAYQALAQKTWQEVPFVVGNGDAGFTWKPYELERARTKGNPEWSDHWIILAQWTEWDMRHLTRDERLTEF